MTAELLRPAAAAARFQVSRRTLSRWAKRGWIGWARVDGVVLYEAQDIADLIAAHTTRRSIIPCQPAAPEMDWREDDLWRNTPLPAVVGARRGRSR